jgi:predicted peptidase
MYRPHLPLLVCLSFMAAIPPSTRAADATPPPPEAQARTRTTQLDPEYQRRTFKGAGDAQLPYGWLTPLNAKPDDKYPLVICLHGSGGSVGASSVLARNAMREQYPAFVMVPQAERPYVWAQANLGLHGGKNDDSPEKMPVLIKAILSLIKTEAIDPARVYITGQSLGGIGSWGAIARHPELFAAAVPVCGAWPVEDVPKMKPVPVWAFHGEKDNTVPTHFSRDLTSALNQAGGSAKYTEYPGTGHNSWTQAYADAEMWKWLFSQRRADLPVR